MASRRDLVLSTMALVAGCFSDPGMPVDMDPGSTSSTSSGSSGGGDPDAGATTGATSTGAATTGAATTGAATTGGNTAETETTSPGTAGTGERPFMVYDLAANFCEAEWSSGAGSLPCPGEKASVDGFAVTEVGVTFEDGRTESGETLLAAPDYYQVATISGYFPSLEIAAGDRFRTTVSCGQFEPNCNVDWEVRYTVDGTGDSGVIASGSEHYDTKSTPLDENLSDLDGLTVHLELIVAAGLEYSSHDVAYWAAPRVVHP